MRQLRMCCRWVPAFSSGLSSSSSSGSDESHGCGEREFLSAALFCESSYRNATSFGIGIHIASISESKHHGIALSISAAIL